MDVGSKEAGKNEYGLYDMAGNVWEWVSDYYDADYYKSSPSKNPQGSSVSGTRVIRGGTWGSSSINLRSSNRRSRNPSIMDNYFGFRCAKSQ
jgi:formylglycine-generating enzyme required for sulfatase activity